MDDILFIDNREETTSTRRRYAFFNDDDDESTPSSSQQSSMFTTRNQQRQRMVRRIDDEDDTATPQQPQQAVYIDEDYYSEEDDDDNEDQDMPEYINNMTDFDYRFNPTAPPVLSEADNHLINEDLKLLKQKGIYPYEYMNSFDRFQEPTLPPIEAFKSSLKGEGISEKDYARVYLSI